jgi:hypothetical protein
MDFRVGQNLKFWGTVSIVYNIQKNGHNDTTSIGNYKHVALQYPPNFI